MAYLSESSRRYLKQVNRQQAIHTMTPNEVRSLRANDRKIQLSTRTSLKEKVDKLIPMRDGEQIPIRIYTPNGNGPFPLIIYYHGGGWVLNDIDTCDATCQLLAERTKSIVISVGYRLAPEYQFPIPVHDAYDAFLWAVDCSKELNGLQSEVTVMGDSAGGNLATVVAILNNELQGPAITSQVLLYPVTDLNFSTDSYRQFSEGYGLQKKDMEWFAHFYLQEKELREHPYVAPLKASNLNHLPKACIVVAENDVLRDEGTAYAQKLVKHGNHVEFHTANGLVHSFFTKNDFFNKEIEETLNIIHAFLEN
ncbi:alpha/beta hydrolase [Ureibacillus sinduriensis]|uniref:Esterase n=1 Tax=Ureibacillus sinduriensis BLB-1 = JCM 15800 TaxID=1384057 RepID=A0A0A3IIZ9_9BACL|nr:alpha/beta hydrolase [Ureibacillus sinduriensis]KGR74817.1 esterase [Ureibacillus sinduriensis BLB-1 = JCM 15800]